MASTRVVYCVYRTCNYVLEFLFEHITDQCHPNCNFDAYNIFTIYGHSNIKASDPMQVLQQHKVNKQPKYQAINASRREPFHPFVTSVSGLLAPAATQLLYNLDALTTDRQKTFSTMMQHLWQSIAIMLVKAVHHGSLQLPIPCLTPCPNQSQIPNVGRLSTPVCHHFSRSNCL